MNIAIVEDLQEDALRLQMLLSDYIKRYDFTLKIAFFPSAEAFLSAVTPEQFDLCFMDVFMEGMNGVAAAEKLRSIDSNCLVIFLTSSPDYMQEGFRLRAWRYLLKPVTMPQLCEALPECVEQIQLSKRRLTVMVDRKKVEIPFSKIYYVATANRSIELHGRDACVRQVESA